MSLVKLVAFLSNHDKDLLKLVLSAVMVIPSAKSAAYFF